MKRLTPQQQQNLVDSHWTMMMELESQAFSNDDRVLMVQVEGWFRQWNELTGDNRQPRWVKQ